MWRGFRQVEHLLKHPEDLLTLLSDALKKAYSKRSLLRQVFRDFLSLFRLVKAWVKGEYRQVPRKAVFWAVLAIAYFLSPLDFIPDIFPGGYIDDITMISLVIRKIQEDLDRFKRWETNQKQEPSTPVES